MIMDVRGSEGVGSKKALFGLMVWGAETGGSAGTISK